MGNNSANGNANGSFVSAAFILGLASLLSRLVGLFRERVFTTQFGAGDTFDAFVAAFRIPDAIFNLVVIGALSAAFIPLFTEKLVKHHDAKDAFTFASSILNLIMVAVAVLGVAYALAAPWLVPLITPGFSGEKLELTIMLSRIMALQPIILAMSFVVSGVLNSFKRFAAYALAPILYNVGIIFGVIFLVPLMGPAGLGWGVVIGAFLHVAVQLPSLLAVGFRWQGVFISSWQDMKAIWIMLLPRVFGLAAQQVNLLTVTILGSGLLAGSISAFYLANNIQYVPVGIFGLAFAQAVFPTLAEQIARGEKKQFRDTLTKTFRYVLFLVIPTSVFFFLLRAQIVRVLFGDGAFDWQDTIMTFETFGALTISIFAQATIPLLTRAFYVQQDTKTPVIISVLSIALNVGLALWLTPRMGVQGLAIAFSASAIFNLLLLLGTLHWQLDGFNDKEVLTSVARISLATVLGGAVLQLLKVPVALVVNMERFWGVAAQLGVTFVAGLGIYFVACYLMKSPELAVIRKYLPRRFKLKAGLETPRFGGQLE
ncbi:MAG: murein biosynthesis integral membrane protein MurJ [Candidatus Andersenbacteria bacterium]|nr:murein biosynthesis integral membrane protein MurJ [Candidatus Andersenbacteria bacterium]